MPTDFAPTEEQQNAIELFRSGQSLAIEAGAGTGKTSTLILLAEAMPAGQRGQYISFNKAIALEAGSKFPKHVACSTAHSLAMRSVGRQYAHRLGGARMKSPEIARRLGISEITVQVDQGVTKRLAAGFLAGQVMVAIERFCQSADMRPEERHFAYIDAIDLPRADGSRTWANNNAVQAALLPAMLKAWADLIDPKGQLPYSHAHYLKAWHLSGPEIPADVIFFDEAQDANPVLLAIVGAQKHAQLVFVGDSQQQIYEFTGAVNALAQVPAELRAFLTQSFRFGPAIAAQANRVLEKLEADLRIEGFAPVASTVQPITDPTAILCRTNAKAVEAVLEAQREGRRVHLVGGGGEVTRFAKAAAELQTAGRTGHPELACFESWLEVQEYVENDPQGSDLKLLVGLIDKFGSEQIIAALDRMIREEDAQLIVSTAHKSKGREWDRVQLASDFGRPKDGSEPSPSELRLLYVAATRAKLVLDISLAPAFGPAPAPAAPAAPLPGQRKWFDTATGEPTTAPAAR